MTIEELRDELRQLNEGGKEKVLESLLKEKSQEAQRKFEAMKAEYEEDA